MYKSAEEFIQEIETRKASDSKREDFLALMDQLGHPERGLKCIHVAGTNGKGSVTDYLRSILQENGYKVGTFTSPHLEVHNDRIRINNENIPDEKLLELANRFADILDLYPLGMFRIDMLLSIYYFLEEKVDYVIYEVGLGGRLDATNIIQPLVSVITNIGYDHMEILGDTLDKIAYEKAGIIKENTPVFTAEDKEECLSVFRKVAEERHSPLFIVDSPEGRLEGHHTVFAFEGKEITLNTMALYQSKNANLALKVAQYLNDTGSIPLAWDKIQKGVESTFWKGRFEVMCEEPLTLVDGAHNEHGVQAILQSASQLKKPLCIVVSILRDKEYAKMLQALKEIADELVVTTFSYYRAASIADLSSSIDATVISDYKEAISYAQNKYKDGSVLITGSLYFVSEARNLLKGDRT